ncbi:hypothetical protein C4569_01355 [Candidatus Parcubacteria bacterium]|nr:MAG: hypothetical protein C4569_01355 [Candidatus Parcubacteria bacterium]
MEKITGECVCPGKARGKIINYKAKLIFNNTDIVIIENWLPQIIFTAKSAGALICSHGSITSHASIVARELNIPSLVKVQNLNLLKDGDVVTVDALEETIQII